ncbi:MAG: ATP-binding protein [Bacteroidaceae bacterium]|nr:ATP-binding protein [Bacteroidaceae bacterium]
MAYIHTNYHTLTSRLKEPRHFIQVLMGPRQVGKTTVVKQVVKDINIPYSLFSADNTPTNDSTWISTVWSTARSIMKGRGYKDYILVIDEIQKIANWSEAVKKEWDYDTWNDIELKVILLGSSRVMLEKGLSESLAGRYEEIRMSHWRYNEMKDAFGMSLNEYIYYGGYPGAAGLIKDPDRWTAYISSSIVDATINKDILNDTIITKPALLRQVFELGASYSSQELSLTKMLGQLNDAGNTTTVANYLKILSDSGMLCALQKYSNDQARKRASAPKFQVYNNALHSLYAFNTLEELALLPKQWGRHFESAIGAHLASFAFTERYNLYYWRDNNMEVDYILQKNGKLIAIEVKSNNESHTAGLDAFNQRFHPQSTIIVGQSGMSAEDFLSISPSHLF